jgi:hypothetical protein
MSSIWVGVRVVFYYLRFCGNMLGFLAGRLVYEVEIWCNLQWFGRIPRVLEVDLLVEFGSCFSLF